MDLTTTIIVLGILILGILIGYFVGKFLRDRFWEGEIEGHRKDAIVKSRAVLGGMFSEQLAPYLPDFPYNPSEVRFLGKPIDFLVFKGMDEKKIDEVVFLEVKSGKSNLNKAEKTLKDTIEKKKVRWEEYRIDEGVTKGKEE
ncbi:MAG: Holliday junction resolvase-like protein [archaeon]